MYADDTIAAIATASGSGGIGIVRASGPLAGAIGASVFVAPRQAEEWTSHHLYYGSVVDAGGTVIDQGLAVLMRGPRSYTGEDVLEVHCHGSPVVLRRVLARVLECGARLAEPGEFTKRAFLNGRLDLTQAEAVLEMVRARTEAGAQLAAAQLCGQLSHRLGTLRSVLIGIKALLEAQIDFAEEDFEVDAGELLRAADRCQVTINDLLSTYKHGLLIREGLRVPIIGKPNVGKSSLLNALLGEERAIVTPTAGTTRDAIDESADFGGIPVVLSDTAGLRATRDADVVEQVGMQRTAARIADADVLLTVLDSSQPLDERDYAVLQAAGEIPQVVVLNKADLPSVLSPTHLESWTAEHPVVVVSATRRVGLDAVRRLVVEHVPDGKWDDPSRPVLTNLRHVDALQKAARSLSLARQAVEEQRPADLVAVDVQDAIDHVASVTGAISSEDVLDRIFSEFCIGK